MLRFAPVAVVAVGGLGNAQVDELAEGDGAHPVVGVHGEVVFAGVEGEGLVGGAFKIDAEALRLAQPR